MHFHEISWIFEGFRALRCQCDLFAQSRRLRGSPEAFFLFISKDGVRYMDMVAKVEELQPRPQTPFCRAYTGDEGPETSLL